MNLFDLDLLLPILGSVLAGGAIGAEREYRASPAGFRTHMLVSLSCALLMLAAVHQVRWLSDTPQDIIRIDPVRMAHGVLTGIGFLCGGVIFREGYNVRGLTTAASLWMTASLGILFGVGFYYLAIAGTIVTLGVLAAVVASERLLPQHRYARIKVRYLKSAPVTAGSFRAALHSAGFTAAAISHNLDGECVELSATVGGAQERRVEDFAAFLIRDSAVQGFDIQPHDM